MTSTKRMKKTVLLAILSVMMVLAMMPAMAFAQNAKADTLADGLYVYYGTDIVSGTTMQCMYGTNYLLSVKEVKNGVESTIANSDVVWSQTTDTGKKVTIDTSLPKGIINPMNETVGSSGTLTATYDNYSASVTVDEDVAFSGIDGRDSITLGLTGTFTLNYGLYVNETVSKYLRKNVTITSSNTDVVDDSCIDRNLNIDDAMANISITPKKAGTTTLTFSYGGYTIEKVLTSGIKVIYLKQTSLLLKPGVSSNIEYLLQDGYKAEDIVWDSSNKDVATVDTAGKVTALKNGTAAITAKIGTKTKTCGVTVMADGMYRSTDISKTISAVTLNGASDKLTLEAWENVVKNPDVAMMSDNTQVIAGSDSTLSFWNKTFTPVANGTANIYVYKMDRTNSSNYSAKCLGKVAVTVTGCSTTAGDPKDSWKALSGAQSDSATAKIEMNGHNISYNPTDEHVFDDYITDSIGCFSPEFDLTLTGDGKNYSQADADEVNSTAFADKYLKQLQSYIKLVDSNGDTVATVGNGLTLTGTTKIDTSVSESPFANIKVKVNKALKQNKQYKLVFDMMTPAPNANTSSTNIYRVTSYTFTTSKAKISDAVIKNIANQGYTGSAITPDLTLTFNGKTLTKDTDYIVEYAGNTNVGTATVTVKGKGDFAGTATKTFKIVPKASKVYAKSKNTTSNKVTVKKVSGVTAYKVYRSTSKNGKYKLIKTIKAGKKLSFNDSKLKFNKKYYYKTRVYKTVSGKQYYSAYSNIKMSKPSLQKVSYKAKAGTKTIVSTWKKVQGADGYVLYRSKGDKKHFKKISTRKGGQFVKYTSTNRPSGTYYNKMRAYKIVKGKKVYGAYSGIEKVKVK